MLFVSALTRGGGLFAQTAAAGSAADLENALLWRQATGGAALDSPSAQMGSVTLLCEGGFVRAYGESGKPLWEYNVNGRLAPFIVRSGTAMSFFGRTNGTFYALNRSGRLLWDKKLGEALAFTPVLGWDGRVFVFLRKKIICLTATGNQLWEYKTEDYILSQPIPNGHGGFIAALKNNTVLLVNAFGGVITVELAAPPAALLPGSYPDIVVLYAGGEAERIRDGVSPKKAAADSAAQAAKTAKAAPKTAATAAAPAQTPPEVKHTGGKPVAAAQYKRNAAILMESNEIVFWSLDEEQPLWTQKTLLGGGNARLLFDERGVYVFSLAGAAGWLADGRMLWNMKIQGAAAPPALSSDGVLYASGTNWLLYAYQVERRGKTAAEGALFPFNVPDGGNYGLGSPPDSLPLIGSQDVDEALALVARALKRGAIGENERFACALLLGLVNGGESAGEAPSLIQRLEALRLLRFLGTRETVPFLARKLAAERDPNIQAGIMEAIGYIGVDPGLRALGVYETLIPLAVSAKNARLLSAMAESLGLLCRFSGPPLSSSGVRLLTQIAGAQSSKAAADIAKRELDLLFE